MAGHWVNRQGLGTPRWLLTSSQALANLIFSVLAFFHVPKTLKLDFIQLPLVWVISMLLLLGVYFLEGVMLSPATRLRLLPSQWQTVRKCFPLGVYLKALYIHSSPTTCHGMVAWTCHCFPSRPLIVGSLHGWHINLWRFASAAEHLAALLNHLQQWGWAVNPQKIQGPGTALTFLGVIWSGKTHIVPESVTDILQASHYHGVWKRCRLLWEFWGTGE